MADIRQPLIIARRTLLIVGWTLALAAMTRENNSQTATRLPAPRATASPVTKVTASDASPSALPHAEAPVRITPRAAPVRPSEPDREFDDDSDDFEGVTVEKLAVTPASEIPAQDESGRPNYVAGQLIVRFQDGTPVDRELELIAEEGARVLSVIRGDGRAYVLELPADDEVAAAVKRFARLEEIDYAEPELLHYVNAKPSDAYYGSYGGQQDELQRWYFSGVGSDRNLNAEAAWDITTGNSSVVIAIIDTGVLLTHPDLAANLWTNSREIAGNGVDDENNGYVDDRNGWDFYFADNDPNPDYTATNDNGNVFHGTFVAGCAAAVSGNGVGVAGVSWRSRVMPLKVFAASGGAPSSAIASAIRYAADNGAHIINMSFGSSFTSFTMSDAIAYAWTKGVVLVAAAGNGNSDLPQYPARYPNVLSVGGTGGGSRYGSGAGSITARASFSQFGTNALDVVAPAVDIVSTSVLSMSDQAQGWGTAGNPSYFFGNGTSFAAPLVAGEAALLISRAQDLGLGSTLKNGDFRRYIVQGTVKMPDDPTDLPDAGPTWANRGRVDLLAALQRVGPKPTAPGNVSATVTGPTSVRLTWLDNASNETSYKVKRAVVTGSTTGAFQILAVVPANSTTFTDTTAQRGSSYRYKVIPVNNSGKSPATSNLVSLP